MARSFLRSGLFYISTLVFFSFNSNSQTKAYCDSVIVVAKKATKNKNYVESLKLLFNVYSIAQENDWYEQSFLALNYIGANYASMADFSEAFSYSYQAQHIAENYLNDEFKILSLNNLATLYTATNNYKKAKEYSYEVYLKAKRNKYEALGVYLVNLANIENITGNPQQARRYIEEAIPNLKHYWPKSLIAAHMVNAESSLLENKFDEARTTAIILLDDTEGVKLNGLYVALNEIIIKSYISQNKFNDAMQTALLILGDDINNDERKRIFELMAKIAVKRNLKEEAILYKDSIINIQNKLNQSGYDIVFRNAKVKIELKNIQDQAKGIAYKSAIERKIFLIVVFIIFITAIISILIFKHKKSIAERNFKITALELEVTALELDKKMKDNLLLDKEAKEKEMTLILEQERLKNEIETKNKKLSVKALHFSKRNELLEDLLATLFRKRRLIKDEILLNQMYALKNYLKNNNEWENFINHFEEVNQNFLNRLKTKHPELTSNDIRFITYVYMNLSIKEISLMLNITIDACRKRNERLKLKMGIPSNINLYDYISMF